MPRVWLTFTEKNRNLEISKWKSWVFDAKNCCDFYRKNEKNDKQKPRPENNEKCRPTTRNFGAPQEISSRKFRPFPDSKSETLAEISAGSWLMSNFRFLKSHFLRCLSKMTDIYMIQKRKVRDAKGFEMLSCGQTVRFFCLSNRQKKL